MDQIGRIFALKTLRFRWAQRKGSAFEGLFADLMQNAWPGDFQKVRPYGPRGDLKCDGYWRSRKCVFQCYAPLHMKEGKVIPKIKGDLAGAASHWPEKMHRWCFVHNDLGGLTANVVQVLEDLRSAHPAIKIEVWGWPQIREQFYKLPDEAVVDLFGHPPTTASYNQLSFEELRPVVEYVAKATADRTAVLDSPPSVRKLEKNSLDEESVAFLRLGRRKAGLVEEFFAQHHDPTLGDRIADAMWTQYQMLVDSGLHSEEVLVHLQRFAGWDSGNTNTHNAAVLAVITYFFDRCDIFEDPDENSVSPAV